MSKIDEKYIESLDIFTSALEQIVETLKAQQKNDKSDVVNEFLNAPMDNLAIVVGELKDITQKGFAELKSDNKEIIEKIESIKKQKESGMFDKVEDPKNKNKIVDGIKVVILIAAGVLALGMAFKIIGKVDFLSVIALSVSMYVMSQTFSKIADIKGLKFTEILKIASFMPIMALGILLSGKILSGIPTISFKQGLSILFIGGSLGLASFLLLKAMSKIDPKSILMAPVIPFLLPLVALGIVKSSEILPGVKSISFKTVIDVALIGLAMGVATFAIGLALKHIKNVTWKEMLMIPLMLPLIAGGIVLSSSILKDFDPIKDPLKLLIGAATIGLSILLFIPAIKLLSKLKSSEIIKGSFAAIAVSGVILASAWAFSTLPDNMKYPSVDWTLSAGLSVLTFGLMTLGLGAAIALTAGLGLGAIALGAAAVLIVVGTIVATSYALHAGKYDGNYPSLQWSLGVSAALLGFSLAMVAASAAGISSAIGSLFTGGEDPLAKVAKSMVEVSYAIQGGKYDGNYPKEEWAKGVGTALLLFTTATVLAAAEGAAIKILSFFTGDSDPLMTMTKSIVAVSKEIQNGVYKGNYPSLEWAAGVGAVLLEFSLLTIAASAQGLVSSVLNLFSGDSDPLMTLAKSISGISRELQTGIYTGNFPGLDWSTGVSVALLEFTALTVAASAQGLISSIANLFSGDSDPLMSVTKSMVNISKELQNGIYTGNYPSVQWASNVSKSIIIFSSLVDKMDISSRDAINFNMSISNISAGLKSMSGIKQIPNNLSDGYTMFFNGLKNMPRLTASDSKITAVKTLTDRFAEMANTLGKVNTNLQTFVNNYNKLDIQKLDKLSESVDKSASALGVKKPEETPGIFNRVSSAIGSLFDNKEQKAKVESIQKQNAIEDRKRDQFYSDISEIRRILVEMKDDANKPTKAGSFHK